MYKQRNRQGSSIMEALSFIARKCFLLLAIFSWVVFLPINNDAFAQSDPAEIEFWQSVKSSKDPGELQAYIDVYPDGKFAPLARIRIKRLSTNPAPVVSTPPAPPPQPSAPPPRVELPLFKSDDVNVTTASCRRKLGQHGVAEADFDGNGYICLCQYPYELSEDGNSCNRPTRIAEPPEENIITAPPKPKRVKKTKPAKRRAEPRSAKKRRRPLKRPPRAQARAIANRYCRRRYGKNLKHVVVKRTKFYCHYYLSDGSYLAVKKRRFEKLGR